MSNDCKGEPVPKVQMDEQSPGHRGSHTMRKSSNSKASKPSQPGGRSGRRQTVQPKSTKTATKTRVRGAAQFTDEASRIGLRDLVAHKVSWLAGYIYVGNGTIGATDALYFRAIGGTNDLAPSTSGGGQVPVLGSDSNVGQTYVADIEKHYSRKILKSCKLRFVSQMPSTANSAMAVVAPVRGCGASGDTVTFTSGTTAACTIGNTLGMSGAKSFASYENTTIDLTPYIAGGSGAKQNEFTINRDGETSATAWGSGNIDLTGIAPCAFVVAGTCGTAALRGAATHYVVAETVCDYLDFLAGNPNPNPIQLSTGMTREEAMMVLRALLAHPSKEMRDLDIVRKLTKCLSQLPKSSE